MRNAWTPLLVAWMTACASSDSGVHDAPIRDAPPIRIDAQSTIGCADGSREGFTDQTKFPTIAGCGATWLVPVDMRAAATGNPCGNDLHSCTAPADACSPDWHLCGVSGDPLELAFRLTAAECAAQTGSYVAAQQHCTAFATPCVYSPPYGCPASGTCSEPVCCGTTCHTGACRDGVFAGATTIAGAKTAGCGALDATGVSGVLCCR